MANVTADGEFVLKNAHDLERFTFAMSNETMFIQVQNRPTHINPNFTFLADREEAIALRDWLNTQLET